MLKIGMYEQDLTPIGPVNLPGQFYQRVSDKVESKVCANIFACEGEDGAQLIIAAIDQTSITSALYNAIKEEVAKKCPQIDAQKLIVSATHIHTAPGYKSPVKEVLKGASFDNIYNYFPVGSRYVPLCENAEYMDEEEYFVILKDKIADGIVSAWNKRQKAYIAPEFGRAVVGHSRRVAYNDGTAKMYGIADKATFSEMESGNDSGVELLYVFDESKKPMGVIANIACPAQVLEHCSFISSDYWGKTREMLKQDLGSDFVTVGLCAAAGCQAPRDMIRFVLPDTMDPNLVRDNEQRPRKTDPDMYAIEGAIEIGERVSMEILRKLKYAKENMQEDAAVKNEVKNLNLPLRKVTETDRLNAQKSIDEYFNKHQKKEYDAYDKAAIHIFVGVLDRYKQQETERFFKMELHTARLGNIAFATNPFELFLDYGNKIRARSVATQTFLIQLACGKGGYLPTKKAEQGSHYSAYVASGNVGHDGGEILVGETLETIAELFKD
ncbi:MAG: hypothetical protein IKJ68_05690 [Clostridia bacterium]|nr:hypothetical protein [Clostridia bacterium]